MNYEFPPHLWAPQRRGIELTVDAWLRGKSVCLYGPTGSGKTTQAATLFQWAASRGLRGCFYVNRRLLIQQTFNRFVSSGLDCGIRAAEYEHEFRPDAPFQICSADTERARVINKPYWAFHDAQVVLVDEMHLQRTDTMRTILDHYKSQGAFIAGLTATPIGLSEWLDELVISGRLAEYRECKALVPAVVRSIETPDVSKIKRNATGEFVMDGKKRQVYTQSIVANVIDRWKKYNPDARPTLLFAPGVAESVWFSEQFQKIGVKWAHVDATDAVIDGHRRKLDVPLWTEIQERYNSGEIKGISCRFKVREGVDLPKTYHAILATPIGSLASYLQTCGRVIRYSEDTPDHVLITDHGGCYHRHGSPNHDRDWADWWSLPEGAVSEAHTNSIKDRKTKEPIRCPKCEMERTGGVTCPGCGWTHEKSKRLVIMEDGKLVEKEGALIKPRFVKREPNTEELWMRLAHGWRKKKVDRSWNQLAGYFVQEHGYHPPRNLRMMPRNETDWYRKVHEVSTGDLY